MLTYWPDTCPGFAAPPLAAAPTAVPRMKLGSQGLEVSAQGLGCMGMSAFYGPPKPELDMVALIHHAVATGVTFLDTSDVYGPHTNKVLLGKALQGGVREKVYLATKFGISFVDGKWEIRGDAACEGSLKRLGVDCVDLYYQHRIDKRVPIELSCGVWSTSEFKLLGASMHNGIGRNFSPKKIVNKEQGARIGYSKQDPTPCEFKKGTSCCNDGWYNSSTEVREISKQRACGICNFVKL